MSNAKRVDMKLEVVVIPVSDVDRAKQFYQRLGWRLDADFAAPDGWRVVQFTPPGSGCSVIFGANVTAAAPGSSRGLYLIVSDIRAAREELLGRGAAVSEVFHAGSDAHAGADEPYLFGRVRLAGPDPARGSYRSYASFQDPDGNGWLLQEVTSRLAGRVDPTATTFSTAADVANTRRGRASKPRTGRTGTPRTWSPSSRARSFLSERRPVDRPGRSDGREASQIVDLRNIGSREE